MRIDGIDLGYGGADQVVGRGFGFAGVSEDGVLAAVDVVEDFGGEAEFDDVVDPWFEESAGDLPFGAVWPEEVEEDIGVDGDEGFLEWERG